MNALVALLHLWRSFHRVWKDENAQAGRLAYEQCQALPIRWLHEEPALLERKLLK